MLPKMAPSRLEMMYSAGMHYNCCSRYKQVFKI